MIACGVLALATTGGMSPWLGAAFAAVLVVSWKLEGTKWRLSERAGLVIVLLSLPLFYLDWKLQGDAGAASERTRGGIAALVHLTLFLSSVKLLQVKADRDWLFLYLISFFEVLLAAGLNMGLLYFGLLAVYVFCALLTIISFELRKARRLAPASESRLLVADDGKRRSRFTKVARRRTGVQRRLPLAAACLLGLIFALALPIFLITPRSGNGALIPSAGAASTGYVGFSDRVSLGEIGRLQQNDQLVMRVRVEESQAAGRQHLRWRGVALDQFDGRAWKRTYVTPRTVLPTRQNLFELGKTESLDRLTTQTFFVEPIDTPVLFVAPRAVAVQGALPFVRRDGGDGLTSRLHVRERLSYRAYSDTFEPPEERLRADDAPYYKEETPNLRLPVEKYLQLPEALDPRVARLASAVVERSGARGRYETAVAIEAHLGRNAHGGAYGYTLEMKANGPDPLADFLFRVREGHCEYFATAMAVMLRTRGVAARVVNGFQAGSYNDAADAYVVRQSDAHSWVEAYFPETDSWVTFDPTPASGRPGGGSSSWQDSISKYAEALDLLWLQYVVGYDRQEQRSLAHLLKRKIGSYRDGVAAAAAGLKDELRHLWNGRDGGDDQARLAGLSAATTTAVGASVLVLLAFLLLRKKGGRLQRIARSLGAARRGTTAIDFYERMMKALDARGLRRGGDQTPLEFALAVGNPEVMSVTEAFQRVRYGGRELSETEAAQVERWLERIERESDGPSKKY